MPQYLADISGENFTLCQDEARHLKVARSRIGDDIKIFDGKGKKFSARITALTDKSASGIINAEIFSPAPEREIHLYFSAISRPATEDLLDKCTQAGAYAFHPVISARSDADLLKKWDSKLPRWQSILLAACKQCEMPRIPFVYPPVDLKTAMKAAMPAIVCYEGERTKSIIDALSKIPNGAVAIFIGPEGGYSDEEAKTFSAAKIIPVSLGINILRAETAALAACWAAMQ